MSVDCLACSDLSGQHEFERIRGAMSDDQTSRILAAIQALRGDFQALRGDLMDRIDRLQDGVSGLRDDIGVNFARSDRVDERSTGIEREVRAVVLEVSAMHRQIQRLQTDVRTLKGEP
jgi:hypothetical protein